MAALTIPEIKRLAWDPSGPSIQLHPDGGVPGLFVRCYPSGKKSYVLRYRPVGSTQPKTYAIGQHGKITQEQARTLAKRALAAVAEGKDPMEERKAARKAATVKEFAPTFLEKHSRAHNRSWREDARRLDRHIVPALGSKKLEAVTRADVARLHQKIGDTKPTEANRVLALVSVMFSRAAEWGHVPAGHPNPAQGVRRYRERSRTRWVLPSEMPALLQAIEAEPNIYARAALLLLLFTGMRKSEILTLRWEHVDLDRCEIRLPTSKANRSHVVPLSAPAVEVLRSLPKMLRNPHVIASTTKSGGRLVNLSKCWLRVRARHWLAMHPEEAAALREQAKADIGKRSKHAEKSTEAVDAHLLKLAQERAGGADKVTVHDLRRTTGSWLAESGASLPLIGRVLNHSNASTTQVYARLSQDPAREALERHGARLTAITTSKAG